MIGVIRCVSSMCRWLVRVPAFYDIWLVLGSWRGLVYCFREKSGFKSHPLVTLEYRTRPKSSPMILFWICVHSVGSFSRLWIISIIDVDVLNVWLELMIFFLFRPYICYFDFQKDLRDWSANHNAVLRSCAYVSACRRVISFYSNYYSKPFLQICALWKEPLSFNALLSCIAFVPLQSYIQYIIIVKL